MISEKLHVIIIIIMVKYIAQLYVSYIGICILKRLVVISVRTLLKYEWQIEILKTHTRYIYINVECIIIVYLFDYVLLFYIIALCISLMLIYAN